MLKAELSVTDSSELTPAPIPVAENSTTRADNYLPATRNARATKLKDRAAGSVGRQTTAPIEPVQAKELRRQVGYRSPIKLPTPHSMKLGVEDNHWTANPIRVNSSQTKPDTSEST